MYEMEKMWDEMYEKGEEYLKKMVVSEPVNYGEVKNKIESGKINGSVYYFV